MIGAYAAVGALGGALIGYAGARSHAKWTYWQWEALIILAACTSISATLLGAVVDRLGRGRGAMRVASWATFAAGAFNGVLVLITLAVLNPHERMGSPFAMLFAAMIAGLFAAIPFFPATLAVAAAADAVHARSESLAASSQARGTFRAVTITASIATMLSPAHADHPLFVHVPLWIATGVMFVLPVLLVLERRTLARVVAATPEGDAWEPHDLPILGHLDQGTTGLVEVVDHGVGDQVWARTRADGTYRTPACPIAVVRGDPDVARAIVTGAERTTWAAMGIAVVAVVEQVALR